MWCGGGGVVFFIGKNTLKYWCLGEDEPSLAICSCHVPCIKRLHRELTAHQEIISFQAGGSAWLTCPSGNINTLLRFYNFAIIYHKLSMEIYTAAMFQSYVLMSGTLSILYFECSPSQIQWCAVICSMT